MNKRSYAGFTLVEVIVVVVVISILATISTFGMTKYFQDTRDSRRNSDVTIITEALEKYYEKNGEYPNCSQMTRPAGELSALLRVDADVLKPPRSTAGNAIICSSLSSSSNDSYSYVGGSCQGTESCLSWTMQYKRESDGAIVTLKSRHMGSVASSGATTLTVTAQSASQIRLSWTAVPNATSYRIERSTSSTMTSPDVTSVQGLTTNANGLVSGKRYYFRVTPYIGTDFGVPASGDATTLIAAPTGTLTASIVLTNSDTQVRVSGSGVTCAPGTTLQYALGLSNGRVRTSDSSAVTYDSWTTASQRLGNAAQGNNYIAGVKARCQGSDATSSEVASTNDANVTRSILTPTSPTYSGDTTWAAGYRYEMKYGNFSTACPAGTWVADSTIGLYRNGETSRRPTTGYYETTSTTPDNYWRYLGWDDGQYYESLTYYASYACKTDFATSSRSAENGGAINVSVTCESTRRSFSASPRCDDHGQDPSTLPLGP